MTERVYNMFQAASVRVVVISFGSIKVSFTSRNDSNSRTHHFQNISLYHANPVHPVSIFKFSSFMQNRAFWIIPTDSTGGVTVIDLSNRSDQN